MSSLGSRQNLQASENGYASPNTSLRQEFVKRRRKHYYSRDYQSSSLARVHSGPHSITHNMVPPTHRNFSSGNPYMVAPVSANARSSLYSYPQRPHNHSSAYYQHRSRPVQSGHGGDSRLLFLGESLRPYRSYSNDERYTPYHNGQRYRQSNKDFYSGLETYRYEKYTDRYNEFETDRYVREKRIDSDPQMTGNILGKRDWSLASSINSIKSASILPNDSESDFGHEREDFMCKEDSLSNDLSPGGSGKLIKYEMIVPNSNDEIQPGEVNDQTNQEYNLFRMVKLPQHDNLLKLPHNAEKSPSSLHRPSFTQNKNVLPLEEPILQLSNQRVLKNGNPSPVDSEHEEILNRQKYSSTNVMADSEKDIDLKSSDSPSKTTMHTESACIFPLCRLDDMYRQLKLDYATERDAGKNLLPYKHSFPVTHLRQYTIYEENLVRWNTDQKQLVTILKENRQKCMHKQRLLWKQYKNLNKAFRTKQEWNEQQLRVIYKNNDEKKRELALVVHRPAANPNASPNIPGLASSTHGVHAPPPSRSRRHGDSVTTEAEFQEILAALERQQHQQLSPLAQAQMVAAEIPTMENDPFSACRVFYDANNLVRDKDAWAKRKKVDFEDDWSAFEHERFTDAFCAYPKRFGSISRALDGMRTPNQCVVHYYATKKKFNYKIKLLGIRKRAGRKPGRKRGRRAASLGETSVTEETVATQVNVPSIDTEMVSAIELKLPFLPSVVDANTQFDPVTDDNSEGDENRRKTCSSYWKFHEVEQFPHLLEAYGTRWTIIADELQTKTANMVRNYYSRNAHKNGWNLIAQLADSRYLGHVPPKEMNSGYMAEPAQSNTVSTDMDGLVISDLSQVEHATAVQLVPASMHRNHQLILHILNFKSPSPRLFRKQEPMMAKTLVLGISTANSINLLLN